MKLNKWIVFAIGLILGILIGWLGFNRPVQAKEPKKVDICHCASVNHCTTLNVSEEAFSGHFDATGNPLHAGDHVGACKKDLCNNIEDVQETIPENYYEDKGACYAKTPVCTDRTATNYDSKVDKKEYADNTVCIYPEKKHTDIIGACDGSATVTIYAGDTRRTWRVDGGDKFWLDYFESNSVKGTIDSVIEWWHNGKWQLFDPTLTYRTPATGCVIPTPEPPKGTTEASAPQCTDYTPLTLPSNVHVIRSGANATVNFFTQSNNANIYFKEVSSVEWQHALRDIPVTGGYVSVDIHDLNPALGYTFGVQASNSCAGGETVLAVVVDGPQSVTFGFSYWEWLK